MAMDGLQRMESDLERVIEKDKDESQRMSSSVGASKAEPMDLRTRLDHLIHSHRFMVCCECGYDYTEQYLDDTFNVHRLSFKGSVFEFKSILKTLSFQII